MKATRTSVNVIAAKRGYEPVQIDGIPEGFAFKEPSLTVGDVTHVGRYVAFIPMSQWIAETATTTEELITNYNKHGV